MPVLERQWIEDGPQLLGARKELRGHLQDVRIEEAKSKMLQRQEYVYRRTNCPCSGFFTSLFSAAVLTLSKGHELLKKKVGKL